MKSRYNILTCSPTNEFIGDGSRQQNAPTFVYCKLLPATKHKVYIAMNSTQNFVNSRDKSSWIFEYSSRHDNQHYWTSFIHSAVSSDKQRTKNYDRVKEHCATNTHYFVFTRSRLSVICNRGKDFVCVCVCMYVSLKSARGAVAGETPATKIAFFPLNFIRKSHI